MIEIIKIILELLKLFTLLSCNNYYKLKEEYVIIIIIFILIKVYLISYHL